MPVPVLVLVVHNVTHQVHRILFPMRAMYGMLQVYSRPDGPTLTLLGELLRRVFVDLVCSAAVENGPA